METVYVALKNEGVPAWRPVHAELVLGNTYRLLGIVPSDEEWEFQPGDVVHCERRILSGSTVLPFNQPFVRWILAIMVTVLALSEIPPTAVCKWLVRVTDSLSVPAARRNNKTARLFISPDDTGLKLFAAHEIQQVRPFVFLSN